MILSEILFPLLLAAGPAPEHTDKLTVFGRLAGQWHFTGRAENENGTAPTDKGEIQIGWILGGSALQDVWK